MVTRRTATLLQLFPPPARRRRILLTKSRPKRRPCRNRIGHSCASHRRLVLVAGLADPLFNDRARSRKRDLQFLGSSDRSENRQTHRAAEAADRFCWILRGCPESFGRWHETRLSEMVLARPCGRRRLGWQGDAYLKPKASHTERR